MQGDTVFTSMDETTTCALTCAVKSVMHESRNQRYFGLNCLESVVLADGVKTSTFGRLHAVPAAWMKYAGSMIGIHRASAIGDAIATILAKIGVI